MIKFRIGDATVTRVPEMIDRMFELRSFFPAVTQQDIDENLHWMAPGHFDPASGRMLLSMHSWLIDTGHCKVLVDGCVGNGKDRPGRPDWCNLDTAFVARLREAGAELNEIDYVLCTHLHADHVGWNTRWVNGRWTPTFPNAKYVFSRREHEYWQGLVAGNSSGAHLNGYRDSVLPVIEAGQALIVDDAAEIAGCLDIVLAPGHTPGHVAIWLKSKGQRGLFTGDIIHHPIQLRKPALTCFGCQDQALSAATRIKVLAECAEAGATLLPAHFMEPFGGVIAKAGPTYWWRDGPQP